MSTKNSADNENWQNPKYWRLMFTLINILCLQPPALCKKAKLTGSPQPTANSGTIQSLKPWQWNVIDFHINWKVSHAISFHVFPLQCEFLPVLLSFLRTYCRTYRVGRILQGFLITESELETRIARTHSQFFFILPSGSHLPFLHVSFLLISHCPRMNEWMNEYLYSVKI